MVTAAPLTIFVGVSVVIVLMFVTFWENISKLLASAAGTFPTRIERAGVRIKPEELLMVTLGAAVCVWIAITLLAHISLLIGLLILPPIGAAALGIATLWLNRKAGARHQAFLQQLEVVLRMMASALRIGLGLRQSMIMVTEEVADPAREEFMRVVGQTNLGTSILDALDQLAERMPSSEMTMTVRAIRVQAKTGGDLAKVLETLAQTIKERRRIHRKMRAMTAQGRAGAYIIAALPIFVGGFIVLTQGKMGAALMFTTVGHIALAAVAALEGAAILSLNRILQFDV